MKQVIFHMFFWPYLLLPNSVFLIWNKYCWPTSVGQSSSNRTHFPRNASTWNCNKVVFFLLQILLHKLATARLNKMSIYGSEVQLDLNRVVTISGSLFFEVKKSQLITSMQLTNNNLPFHFQSYTSKSHLVVPGFAITTQVISKCDSFS